MNLIHLAHSLHWQIENVTITVIAATTERDTMQVTINK